MAQFRTTADILDEILQQSGEATNGNSEFETLALTYANRLHHMIIGGGNFFDYTVDEPWVWARSKVPMVLELQPAFKDGTVTATNQDINITFQTASSVSLEGYHFQVNGKSTVYKITNHSAGGTSAQLDSSFVDDSGVYTFRAFKLDYQIFPTYLYVDNSNDKVDFGETAATTLAATLTHGSYTPANYIAHVVSKIGSVGTASWGGSYDPVLKQFNLTSSVVAKLFGASGANRRRSALSTLGLDQLDVTASSFTSTYTPNQVARMIEPFKLFTTNWWGEPYVYSDDPVRMQEDYPMALTTERIPDRFCRLTEDPDGTIWVRFNSYPRDLTKLTIDWIPQPVDLQDNAASVPKLPRADVAALISGAVALILFDKEDSKYSGMVERTKSALNAMKAKNHGALLRTGQNFGQQVPRADLNKLVRRFNYGYTVNGSTASSTTAESTQSMIARTIDFSSFQTASTVATVAATTLAANRTLFSLIVKHSQVFTGTSISALTLDVGISGDPTKFINAFNPAQAVSATAQDSALVLYFPAVATDIQVRLTATGANLTQLAQGSVTLYFQELIT